MLLGIGQRWARTKFCSTGSSAVAAIRRPRPASGSAAAADRGRCPTASSTTSIRGRPSSCQRHQFGAGQPAVAVEPRPAPISASAWAIGAPSDLMLSGPHSTSATVSGQRVVMRCVEQPLRPAARHRQAKARRACGTGRRRGCCARSAGSSGLRIRSPPGTGRDKPAIERAHQRRQSRGLPASSRVAAARASRHRRRAISVERNRRAAAPHRAVPTTCRPSRDQRVLGLQQLSASRRVRAVIAAGMVDRRGLLGDQRLRARRALGSRPAPARASASRLSFSSSRPL